jgi:hypothetical protein
MPSKIRVGCVVSGATGELYQPEGDEIGDEIAGGVVREGHRAKKPRPRRRRRRRRGTVIDSVAHNKWRVLWEDTHERSDHCANTLKFEEEGEYIRRGTMPPESSVTGVGAFSSSGVATVSVATSAAPIPATTLPTPAMAAATPAMVPATPAADAGGGALYPVHFPLVPNAPPAPQEQDALAHDGAPTDPLTDVDWEGEPWEGELLIPTEAGGIREDYQEEGIVADETFADQQDPFDPACENVDDRYSQEDLFFEYDDELALEMEKGREMVHKMINAVNEKKALMGTIVPEGKGNLKINWKVRDDVTNAEVPDKEEYPKVGIRGFKFDVADSKSEDDDSSSSSSCDQTQSTTRSTTTKKRRKTKSRGKKTKKRKGRGANTKRRVLLFPLLRHMWPGDWRAQLKKLNRSIFLDNEEKVSKSKMMPCKYTSYSFLT